MARLFALVPAAGGGTRFGAMVTMQYASIAGTPMLTRTLSRLRESLSLAATFVALADDDPHFERMAGRPADVVALRCGGATRAATTVGNALLAMRNIAAATTGWWCTMPRARASRGMRCDGWSNICATTTWAGCWRFRWPTR